MNLRTALGSLALWAASVTGLSAAAPATVVDIAVGSKDHTTLVAAVKAAGLVETLSGKGPFTVFARRTPRSPSCRPARSRTS